MESLFEILSTQQDAQAGTSSASFPITSNAQTIAYLTRLSTLSLSDLTQNEPASLSQASQSCARNLQALAKRSHVSIVSSSDHLDHLASILPSIVKQSSELRDGLPDLEAAASNFAAKYERSTENAILDRRKRAMLLSRNADRVSDVLDLPTLLASSVSAAQIASATSASSAAVSYSSALDLSAHVKRLGSLYPRSDVVKEISTQVDAEVQNLRSILITSLQTPNLRLAAAIRTIGWLRRLLPELTDDQSLTSRTSTSQAHGEIQDSGLGALFLVCRLRMLHQLLAALDPLKELAYQETVTTKVKQNETRSSSTKRQAISSTTAGSQSERYLKRYIEIFREQSFNIVSMYKSVFPSGMPAPSNKQEVNEDAHSNSQVDRLLPLPTASATFAMHLVEMLSVTLRQYLPNVVEASSRESLLTQVLYCAGSLGRLGAEFGMFITLLEDERSAGQASRDASAEPEWSQVMKKHRVQASRLEVLARGVGTNRKASGDLPSPITQVT